MRPSGSSSPCRSSARSRFGWRAGRRSRRGFCRHTPRGRRGGGGRRARFRPARGGGEWIAAYALTEPGSGSDAAAMRTEAKREGDEYVLNGSKRFITNAGVAHLYTVFAKTDPSSCHDGISCFMVEGDAPGLEVGRIEPKLGIKGSTTG